jgi:hypothetical protein
LVAIKLIKMESQTSMNHGDTFKIMRSLKFLLIIRLLRSLIIIGVLIWLGTEVGFSDKALLIFAVLGVWAIYEGYNLVKWINFSVSLSGEGITVKNRFIKWDEIKTYKSKAAIKFSTFIELYLQDGNKISIPAAMQENYYILGIIKNHVPAPAA